jgi:hypothetical protein
VIALQLVCLGIVATYVAIRARPAEGRGQALARLALLAVTGWIGEDSVIRAYGFYAYSPDWSCFLDRTPLLIILIWPAVIDSAHLLARRLLCGRAARAARPHAVAALAGAIVLSDAALIEPIAVHAHLWSWTTGGIFLVPPIGIVGWAFFAAAAVFTFEWVGEGSVGRSVLVLAVAPVATHAALVASWWLGFKWLPGAPGMWVVAVVAWCLSLPIAGFALAKSIGRRVPRVDLAARAPGAAFFFALLVLTARDQVELVVYAFAFALPYFALLARPFAA